jgi:hypothetical protein
MYQDPGNANPVSRSMAQVGGVNPFGPQGIRQAGSAAAAGTNPIPIVATPADRFGRSPLLFPIFPEGFNKPAVEMGYWQAAHERYNFHKRYLQDVASAHKHHVDVTRIKFFLKTLLPGKEKATVVGVSDLSRI